MITTMPDNTPRAITAPGGARVKVARTGFPGQDILMAAVIVLFAAAAAYAQEMIDEWAQDWTPAVLRVPENAELLSERSIGSTIRLFSIATSEESRRCSPNGKTR